MKLTIVIGLAVALLVAAGIVAAESVEGTIVKKPYDKAEKKGHGGGGGTPTIVYHN